MTRKRLSVSKMTGSYMSVALQLVVKSDVGTPQDLKSLLNWTTSKPSHRSALACGA